MIYAKIVLAVLIGLGVWSIAVTVRSFFRPLNPTPQKLAATKKSLMLSAWVLFAAFANAVRALTTGQYYLLGASALLFSFVMPLIVHFMRLKAAMKSLPNADLPPVNG
jgi:membrane associated rhomboid family serine protease